MSFKIRPHYQIILVLLVVFCFSPVTYSQRGDESVVIGTVSDTNDAVIPYLTVSFQNQGKIQTAVTSQDGEYSIALAPGTYQVSVAGAFGFESLRRSAILIVPKSTRILNIQMTAKMTVFVPYDDSVPGEMLDHSASVLVGYSYEEITGLSKTGISGAMIAFGTKCESMLSVSFNASLFRTADGGRVTLTYDFLTVTANDVSFDKRTRLLTACGKVTVEVDGKKRILPNCIDLSVKDGKAEYRESAYREVK